MDSGSSRQQMCSRSQATLKNVYFYSGSIYYDPIKPCDDKTLTNIHETVDLYNQEHFMEEINKIACDGAQKIELWYILPVQGYIFENGRLSCIDLRYCFFINNE